MDFANVRWQYAWNQRNCINENTKKSVFWKEIFRSSIYPKIENPTLAPYKSHPFAAMLSLNLVVVVPFVLWLAVSVSSKVNKLEQEQKYSLWEKNLHWLQGRFIGTYSFADRHSWWPRRAVTIHRDFSLWPALRVPTVNVCTLWRDWKENKFNVSDFSSARKTLREKRVSLWWLKSVKRTIDLELKINCN